MQASILYDPYGNVRYTSGTMPGSYGFTGQRADTTTGLDYYNARYYDASAGQFASADSVAAGGLNRYGYVGGNPETATDPTGHMRSGCIEEDGNFICPPSNGGGGGGSSGGSGGGGGGGCGGNPHACAGKGGSGGSGGGPCTHNCAPGCKGTVEQCSEWARAMNAYFGALLVQYNLLQALLALVNLGFDLWKLIRGPSYGVVDTVIQFVTLAADLMGAADWILGAIQASGHDVSGFRHFFDIVGAAANAVMGPLHAFRRGLGIVGEMILDGIWNGFKATFGMGGVELLFYFVGVVVGGVEDDLESNLRSFILHEVEAVALVVNSQLVTEGSIDLFCGAHINLCKGY